MVTEPVGHLEFPGRLRQLKQEKLEFLVDVDFSQIKHGSGAPGNWSAFHLDHVPDGSETDLGLNLGNDYGKWAGSDDGNLWDIHGIFMGYSWDNMVFG